MTRLIPHLMPILFFELDVMITKMGKLRNLKVTTFILLITTCVSIMFMNLNVGAETKPIHYRVLIVSDVSQSMLREKDLMENLITIIYSSFDEKYTEFYLFTFCEKTKNHSIINSHSKANDLIEHEMYGVEKQNLQHTYPASGFECVKNLIFDKSFENDIEKTNLLFFISDGEGETNVNQIGNAKKGYKFEIKRIIYELKDKNTSIYSIFIDSGHKNKDKKFMEDISFWAGTQPTEFRNDYIGKQLVNYIKIVRYFDFGNKQPKPHKILQEILMEGITIDGYLDTVNQLSKENKEILIEIDTLNDIINNSDPKNKSFLGIFDSNKFWAIVAIAVFIVMLIAFIFRAYKRRRGTVEHVDNGEKLWGRISSQNGEVDLLLTDFASGDQIKMGDFKATLISEISENDGEPKIWLHSDVPVFFFNKKKALLPNRFDQKYADSFAFNHEVVKNDCEAITLKIFKKDLIRFLCLNQINTESPIDSIDDLFGRELSINKIVVDYTRSTGHKSYIIYGPPKIGKTSFKNCVIKKLKEDNAFSSQFHLISFDIDNKQVDITNEFQQISRYKKKKVLIVWDETQYFFNPPGYEEYRTFFQASMIHFLAKYEFHFIFFSKALFSLPDQLQEKIESIEYISLSPVDEIENLPSEINTYIKQQIKLASIDKCALFSPQTMKRIIKLSSNYLKYIKLITVFLLDSRNDNFHANGALFLPIIIEIINTHMENHFEPLKTYCMSNKTDINHCCDLLNAIIKFTNLEGKALKTDIIDDMIKKSPKSSSDKIEKETKETIKMRTDETLNILKKLAYIEIVTKDSDYIVSKPFIFYYKIACNKIEDHKIFVEILQKQYKIASIDQYCIECEGSVYIDFANCESMLKSIPYELIEKYIFKKLLNYKCIENVFVK